MKSYPTIGRDISNELIYAFDKLDGSNIRAEWSKKKGFWKFGSRTRLIDSSDPMLGESISLIETKYDALAKAFHDRKWTKATAFFEFYGPSSFAGSHGDDKKEVTLFDVSHDNKGFLEPKEFLSLTEGMDIAALLYTGVVGDRFVSLVADGRLGGMTFEGVVCKGRFVSPGLPLMFKIKNRAWLEKLRDRCSGDEALFDRLS